MKKFFIPIFVISVSLSGISANAAAKVFKNCTELNKIYPGGIALPGAVNAGGIVKKEP